QCVRALKVYGPPSRPGMAAQIAKARDWLLAAKPVSSEQRNMRLLGLYWAGADAAALKPLVAEILGAQQRDGGWRQIDALAPDAGRGGFMRRPRLEVVRDEVRAQLLERIARRVGVVQQLQILVRDRAPLGHRVEVQYVVPVVAAIEDHVDLLRQLVGLHQRQD